jgi:CheY-like chemotaxis protein
MDGKELCKHLQTHPVLSVVPVVFLSATQSKIDLEDCKYTALIKKPFEIEVLLGTISQTLDADYGGASA